MLVSGSRVFLLLSFSSLFLMGCDQSSPPESKQAVVGQPSIVAEQTVKPTQSIEGKVGQVGERAFTEKDIDREFLQMPENFQKMKDNEHMRGNILNNIMTRYALTAEAKKEGVDQDPNVRSQLERMEQNILLQALNKQVKARLKPNEQTIQTYYQTHQKEFMVKEQVHVGHILVKSEALANKLYHRLQRGESFAVLAKKYSTDKTTKNKGGELAPFSKGMMVAEFEKSAFALNKEGSISKPVHTQYGFHIIQLLKHIPVHQKTLADVKLQIVSILTQKSFRDWVEQVKKEMKLQVLKSSYEMPVAHML